MPLSVPDVKSALDFLGLRSRERRAKLRRMNRTGKSVLALLPVLLLPALFTPAACGGNNSNLPPPPPALSATTPIVASAAPTVSATAAPVEDAGGPPAPSLPAPVLVLGAASPDPAPPLPTVRFVAPTKGQLVPFARAADFEIKLDVKNWPTAKGSQHVHLILDNTPYLALYDTRAPIKLSQLPGGSTLSEGQHVLVAFPSRPNHESLKTPGALVVTEFYIGKKTPPTVDITKPMLVYSRPKGEYKGDMATHVLIDFQLVNTTLEPGKNAVTISVKGPGIEGEKTGKAERFGLPFYLDNPQTGKYTLKLELVGPDGAVLPGPWNSTTRDITLDTAASDPGMSHGGDGGTH